MTWKADYPLAVVRDIPSNDWTDANREADGLDINTIIIHYTAGESFGPINFAPGGLAHYGVSRSGAVDQYIQERYIAHHAGNWPVNQHSVGVEHQGFGRPSDWTTAMLEASAKLSAYLCRKYRIPVSRKSILGHTQVGTHTDPGPNFPWDRYMALIARYVGGDIKPAEPTQVYRVITGSFEKESLAKERAAAIKKAAGFDSWINSVKVK